MKQRKKNILWVLVASVCLTACGTTTSITGSYRDPSFRSQKYKKIFIAALTANVPAREKIENSIAQSLNSRGFETVKSIDEFTPDFRNTDAKKSDLALERIASTGCDAIVTIALVKKESESRYVPGSNYPVGLYGYYGTFGGYYGNYFATGMYDPGYYTVDKTYYLETNLYDTKTEKLIWSAQSETLNPSSLESSLDGYKQALARQLIKDGIFPEPIKK